MMALIWCGRGQSHKNRRAGEGALFTLSPETNMTDQLLTSQDVQKLTGIKSRATLWKKSRNMNDRFPMPYKDGPKFTRWKLSEIQQWIDQLELVEV